MKYDFTSIMDRRGKDAIAVDLLGEGDTSFTPGKPKEGYDAIPMWVADMNFPTCPSIPEAVIERAKHPAYGYFTLRDEYFDKIIEWQRDRNDVQGLTRDAIGYENGVLGGVLSALGAFCSRGDYVLLHSPTYIGFTGSLLGSGYRIALSPLVTDREGTWRMDFADMEEKIRKYDIRAAVFCSPHNPCGRVWEREEIEKFAQLCQKYDVNIISDGSGRTLFWKEIKAHSHAVGFGGRPHENGGALRALLRLSTWRGLSGPIILSITARFAAGCARREPCPITTMSTFSLCMR